MLRSAFIASIAGAPSAACDPWVQLRVCAAHDTLKSFLNRDTATAITWRSQKSAGVFYPGCMSEKNSGSVCLSVLVLRKSCVPQQGLFRGNSFECSIFSRATMNLPMYLLDFFISSHFSSQQCAVLYNSDIFTVTTFNIGHSRATYPLQSIYANHVPRRNRGVGVRMC